ncbi:MAG: hypothetical protein V4628_11995 [Pseudomonadota bacterium]
MITQFLKVGFLIASGRFLKPRWKGLLWIIAIWLVLQFSHAEFVSYVELSGDTRYVLHASLLKVLLYALMIGIYVLKVERPLWPKTIPLSKMPTVPTNTSLVALPKGDDGFDFLREKEKLRTRAEQLLDK